MNPGDPPKNTSSPGSTPDNVAVPEALAIVVSSHLVTSYKSNYG